ncbi:MAG: protein O-mannosyl-transferase family [Myxococcota bacterium]
MDGLPRAWIVTVAAGVPFVAYLVTASGYGYWLDAGEFVAASVELGVAHPPGHPLMALLGRAFAFLPLGPLPLRVALASAACAGAASAFLYMGLEHTLVAVGAGTSRLRIPLALGGTWLVAGAHGFWFQAVRPEVYALQAALVLFAVERVLAFESRFPEVDPRPLYQGSLALGLALANHHFLAFLLLPAAAPTLARLVLARGPRALARCALAVALGLVTYAYLPVRAAADPSPNLGEPTTLARLWWVVSAQAFQANQGGGVPQPLGERWADVLVHFVDNLHAVTVLLALAGLYVVFRIPAARRAGFVWAAVAAVYTAGRAWLGFVRHNPDALGYLVPAFAALIALAMAFLGVVLRTVDRRPRPGTVAVLVAVLVAGSGVAQLARGVDRSELATFTATDAFDDPLRRRLPERAVVLAYAPQTVFRLWGGAAVERARPDVTVVPIPFLTYPGMVDGLVHRAPELREMLAGYLLEGELRQPDLQSLAAQRPLLVEMDVRVPPALYETLVPRGLYHEVLPDGATDADARLGGATAEAAWARLYGELGQDPRDVETRNQLLWRHYAAALYHAGFGDRTSAARAAERALRVDPQARELRALREALRAGEGPLDVRPFLVGPGPKHVGEPTEVW